MSEKVTENQLGVSYINQYNSSFLWKIFEFSKLEPRFYRDVNICNYEGKLTSSNVFKGFIQSPEFYTTSDGLKLSLIIFRAGYSRNSYEQEYFVGFRLITSHVNYLIDAKISLTILNGKTGQLIAMLSNENFEPISSSYSITIVSEANADWSNSIISCDEVHIKCEYTLLKDEKNYSAILSSINQFDMNKFAEESLMDMWKNKKFCDFELIGPCGRKLCAHRCILAAQSPVFDAMLTNDMTEKRNQSVTITDISYEALEVMLGFFYLGKIDKLNHELVIDVLIAAEKYQVESLKKRCQLFLLHSLSVENVMQTFKLSKTFGMTDLEEQADHFARSNAKEVLINNFLQNSDNKELIQDVSLLINK